MYKIHATLLGKVDSRPFQTCVVCLGYQIPGISSTKQQYYRIGNCTKICLCHVKHRNHEPM